jgi:hypothetical protein
VSLVACLERNLQYAAIGRFEKQRGSFQAQAFDVLLDAFADQSLEDAVKMKRREMSDPRQLFERQLFIQVFLDEELNLHQALPVGELRVLFHDSEYSRETQDSA